ncbi:MAG TPA: hypothetical protein VGM42_16025, partial [Rhodopila sp.]
VVWIVTVWIIAPAYEYVPDISGLAPSDGWLQLAVVLQSQHCITCGKYSTRHRLGLATVGHCELHSFQRPAIQFQGPHGLTVLA